ncbi:MAG: hypothetical protein ABIE03_01390 [Patescibacteria group bacterium]
MPKNPAIKQLQISRTRLIIFLRNLIKKVNFNYRTFGVDVEEYILNEIINILKEKKIINNDKDFHKAKDKNEFPDLQLFIKPKIALEIKSGNHSKLDDGEWKKCNNSGNDMGTLNKWEEKITEFGGDNIFYIFIEYDFNDSYKKIIDVKIFPFYKFLGLNSDNLLRYREKDGNLRPKDFDKPSPINSFEQFLSLVKKTKIYRSKRIVKKHLKEIPEDQRDELFEN